MKRLLTLLLALPLVAVMGIAQAAELTIRIATSDLSAGSASRGGPVVDVLRSQRMFEDAFVADGIEVQWWFIKGAGPLINEAMSSGQLDLAFMGDLGSIVGRAAGLPTRLLMATGRANNGYLGVVPGSGIQRVEDLKGKRVGTLRGTADHLALVNVLASAGLRERDVKLINMDFNAVSAALVARQIDASWAPARLLALEQRGLIEIPLSSQQLKGAGDSQNGLVVTQAFLDAHPEVTTRVVAVVARALDWLSRESNRQAQIDLGVAQSAYPAAVLARGLKGGDLRFIYPPLLDSYYLETLRHAARQALEARLIRTPVDVDQWIDASVLKQALLQTNLTNAWQPVTEYRWTKTEDISQ